VGVGLGIGHTARVADVSSHATRTCPFCGAPGVARLWLGSASVDCCECTTCWARWDESADGSYRGRTASTEGWVPLRDPR
jgi:hypothetical protein